MAEHKVKRDRSPAFPFISLEAAVKRTIELESTFGRHPAPANKAGLAWRMKEKSSQAFQTLAALKQYGLVAYSGVGDKRNATLTDDARTYLRAQQESIKSEVIQQLALKPRAMSRYWSRWGEKRPPTPVCMDQLVLEDGFTESAANNFLKVYDDNVTYAGLGESDKIPNEDNGPSGKREQIDDSSKPDIGDLVQWESSGVLQFKEPRRVRAVQADGDQTWIFVDDSETGIPASEVTVETLHSNTQATTPSGVNPPTLPLQSNDPRVVATAGEHEAMRGGLGGDVNYRLLISGDLGPKQISKLIRLLEAQRDVLSDDDE